MGRSKTNAAVRELLDTGFILWAEERQLHGGRGLVYVLGHHPTLRAFEDEILCAERSVAEYEKLRTNSPNLHRSDLLAQHAEVMARLAADVRIQYSSRPEDEHLLCAVTSAAVAEVDTEESTRGVSVEEDTNQNREASPPARFDDDPGAGRRQGHAERDTPVPQRATGCTFPQSSASLPVRVRTPPCALLPRRIRDRRVLARLREAFARRVGGGGAIRAVRVVFVPLHA